MFGLPLAVLVAWPLRRIRSQWLHVAALALATGLAFWIAVAGMGGWANLLSGWGVGLFAGDCAAIGRAAVMPMVARRNGRPPTPPAKGPTASW
ncbi:hypothetical protein [Arthrobacter dokdonensis]|uniref:hypothetical protein n=1 Tax=Arthrobacter dokdonellae TaxID=2211210 RepID=UPI000DE5AE2F|nr:hypothetical protein [Arthrobacter dokdonellae]